MLVLCNGMPRSASTWSYNVTLGLLRRIGTSEVHGGYDENVARFLKSTPASAAHIVLKYHNGDPVGTRLGQVRAAKMIYTWRNIADAVVSFMTMFGVDFDRAFTVMSESLNLCRQLYATGNVLILSYEEITTEARETVQKIAAYLELWTINDVVEDVATEMDIAATRKKVEELSLIDSGHRLIRRDRTAYDPATLLHVNHIRNGGSGYGAKALMQSQLRQIEQLVPPSCLPI